MEHGQLILLILVGLLGFVFVLALYREVRTRQQIQRRFLERQEALANLTRSEVFHADNLEEVYHLLTQTSASLLEVARVSLWLFTDNREAIRCLSLYELPHQRHSSGGELRAENYPIYFKALAEGKPLIAQDARADKRTREFTASYLIPLGITAMMDVPILISGRLQGVLCHEQVGAAQPWTSDQTFFAVAICNLITLAIEQTERRQAERKAESANRAKTEFLTNMSHELRTPMAGILGMTELALESTLTPQQREYLTVVKQSGETLLTMLNELLDYSKIEAGKLTLDPTPFRLREVLQELLRLLGVRAQNKNLGLECHIDPTVPDALVGDVGRLRQILTNLVGNAVKFTQQGFVRVRVRLADTPNALNALNAANAPNATSRELFFEVQDTGIGIAPEQRERIFAPFEQADTSINRRFGGTGLGLAISSRLVKLMQGELSVTSQFGQGSTFQFNIRLGVDPKTKTNGASEANHHDSQELTPKPHPRLEFKPARPLQLLLAEDNPVNQLVASKHLERVGHQVRVVENGRQALEQLTQHAFDLILLDLHMPEMDGLETLARLRKREAQENRPRIPAIALTASAMVGDRERCLQAGFDGYVSKPIQLEELFKTIERLVPFQASQTPVVTSLHPIPNPNQEDLGAPGVQELCARFNFNSELTGELIEVFQNTTPRILADILQGIEGHDFRRVWRSAHSLKGAVNHFTERGTLLELTQRLEDAGRANRLEEAASLCPQVSSALSEFQEVLAQIELELKKG